MDGCSVLAMLTVVLHLLSLEELRALRLGTGHGCVCRGLGWQASGTFQA